MEQQEIEVTVTEDNGTINIFVWEMKILIAKIWMYPDGRVTYRSFSPKTTPEIEIKKSRMPV